MGDPGLQRVKVYRLNEEGLWDDKGTGHVSVELVEVRGCSLRCPFMLALLFVRRELVHKRWAWLQLQLTWPARLMSVASRPQGGGVGLVVMGESHLSRPLLIHRISKGNAYQRQGGECLLADFACKLHPPGVPLPW